MFIFILEDTTGEGLCKLITSSRRLSGALDWSGHFEDEKSLLTLLQFESQTIKPIAPVTIPTIIFLTIGPVTTPGSCMTDG